MNNAHQIRVPGRMRRWIRKILVIFVMLPATLSGAFFLLLFTQPQGTSRYAADDDVSTSRTPDGLIAIGIGTTRIVSPVREDGYIDYVAALNEACGRGVSPAENCAVQFWQAVGPEPILGPPQYRRVTGERFFALLGIAVPSEQGDYLLTPVAFQHQVEPGLDAAGQDALVQKIWNQLEEAQRRPWAAREYPELAAWLEANAGPLRKAAQSTRCPRFFAPLLGQDMPAASLLGWPEYKYIAGVLRARALLHVHERQIDAAMDDLLACHRLGRLIATGPTLVQGLLGATIDGMAGTCDAAMAFDGCLSRGQAAGYAGALRDLPPLPDWAAMVNTSERFVYLDSAAKIAHFGPGILEGLGGTGDPSWQNRVNKFLVNKTYDWDEVLRMGNDFYDRLVAALRQPSRAERIAAIEELEAEFVATKEDATTLSAPGALVVRRTRTEMARAMGVRLLDLLRPAARKVVETDDRLRAGNELVQVTLALVAYRADHGSYPSRLSQLCPTYLAQLPKDPFSGNDYRYVPREKDCLVYSVGANGADDGGVLEDPPSTKDDISIYPPPPR